MKHRQLWQMSVLMVGLVVEALWATPAMASPGVDYYVYLPIIQTTTIGNRMPWSYSQSVTMDEDTTKDIVLTALDSDGDPLTWYIIDNPLHGALNGDAPNLTYTPAPDYNGDDGFTFKVNDGTADSNISSITISLLAVNDLPVAQDQSVTTPENTVKDITLMALDVDGDPLTWSIIDIPLHGVLSGDAPNLTYTPAESFYGNDSLTFKVNDNTGDSNIATISILITATDPINNGDFEAGGDGRWIETSSHAWGLITQGLPSGAAPHGGIWAAWLGGGYFELSSLEQTNLTLTGVRYLHYWYWIVSQDTCGNDFANIYVNGVVLKTTDLCDVTSTTSWVEDVIDLNSYVGTSISLKIETTLNGSFHSNLYLDDVSITQFSALAKPDDPDWLTSAPADMR